MIKRLWECSNGDCQRKVEAGLEATVGHQYMKCEKCKAIMLPVRDFTYCDNCSVKAEVNSDRKPADAECPAPMWWIRFSYGASAYDGANYTSGHSKCVDICTENCWSEWIEKEKKYVPGLSKKSFNNNAISSQI